MVPQFPLYIRRTSIVRSFLSWWLLPHTKLQLLRGPAIIPHLFPNQRENSEHKRGLTIGFQDCHLEAIGLPVRSSSVWEGLDRLFCRD